MAVVEEKTPSLSETAVPPSETKGENPMSYPASQFTASNYPKYQFKHFRDDKVKVAVNEICRVLGYYGNLQLIVDHFLDLFHESKLYQKQAVYILSEIVMGSCGRTTDGETNFLIGEMTNSVLYVCNLHRIMQINLIFSNMHSFTCNTTASLSVSG